MQAPSGGPSVPWRNAWVCWMPRLLRRPLQAPPRAAAGRHPADWGGRRYRCRRLRAAAARPPADWGGRRYRNRFHDGGLPERWLTVTGAHPPKRAWKGEAKEKPRGNISISSRWRSASPDKVGPCAPKEGEFSSGRKKNMPGPSEVPWRDDDSLYWLCARGRTRTRTRTASVGSMPVEGRGEPLSALCLCMGEDSFLRATCPWRIDDSGTSREASGTQTMHGSVGEGHPIIGESD